jgi:Bifunctional DNA primase/polymerase, N-terminal
VNTCSLSVAERARLAGWLACAEQGWYLFPIRPGCKEPPVFKQWARHASTDPRVIADYFTRHRGYNAGIACRPSGLVVLDCDLPKRVGESGSGVDNLAELAARRGHVLPRTYTVATPSGGRHLYFHAPPATGGLPALGNSVGSLAPLLDSRGGGAGDGGYVLAPGSYLSPRVATATRVGCAGGGYRLIDDTAPVRLPTWLHQVLAERRPTPVPAPPERATTPVRWPGRYVAAVLRAELARVRGAGAGEHNTAVFTAARALGQLAGAGALDRDEAERLLTRAAGPIAAGPCDCTARGLAASIRSGLAYGANRPRPLPTHGGARTVTPHDTGESRTV